MNSFLGLGYKVNPNFAVVAKYQDLYSDTTASSSAVSVRGVGIIPVSKEFSFNGKLGLGQTKLSIDSISATSAVNYGIGMDYALNRNFFVGLDIDFYPVSSTSKTHAVDQTNVNLVGKYSF
jgi:hypothetical protein